VEYKILFNDLIEALGNADKSLPIEFQVFNGQIKILSNGRELALVKGTHLFGVASGQMSSPFKND
jgi:hypothetical protein